MRIDMPHPTAGTVKLVASPMKFSATPIEPKLPPPTLGQHTDEILAEHGYTPDEIRAFRAKKVVV